MYIYGNINVFLQYSVQSKDVFPPLLTEMSKQSFISDHLRRRDARSVNRQHTRRVWWCEFHHSPSPLPLPHLIPPPPSPPGRPLSLLIDIQLPWQRGGRLPRGAGSHQVRREEREKGLEGVGMVVVVVGGSL